MGYDNLNNYFKTNFALMHHYGYNLRDLEGLIPWERQVYIDLIQAEVQRKNEENREQQVQARAAERVARTR